MKPARSMCWEFSSGTNGLINNRQRLQPATGPYGVILSPDARISSNAKTAICSWPQSVTPCPFSLDPAPARARRWSGLLAEYLNFQSTTEFPNWASPDHFVRAGPPGPAVTNRLPIVIDPRPRPQASRMPSLSTRNFGSPGCPSPMKRP
jgi:hypothetical protein